MIKQYPWGILPIGLLALSIFLKEFTKEPVMVVEILPWVLTPIALVFSIVYLVLRSEKKKINDEIEKSNSGKKGMALSYNDRARNSRNRSVFGYA